MSQKIVCMSFNHAGHAVEIVLEEVPSASDGWVCRMYVDGSNQGYFDKDLNQQQSPHDYFNFYMPYINDQLNQLAGTAPPTEIPEWVQGYKSELMSNWVYNGTHIVVDV
jgi:hypothetical protein